MANPEYAENDYRLRLHEKALTEAYLQVCDELATLRTAIDNIEETLHEVPGYWEGALNPVLRIICLPAVRAAGRAL